MKTEIHKIAAAAKSAIDTVTALVNEHGQERAEKIIGLASEVCTSLEGCDYDTSLSVIEYLKTSLINAKKAADEAQA